MKYKILFVCLGNICRSSAAEEIMRQKIRKSGVEDSFFVDSAGLISYHQGEMADPRMRMHAKRRGYDITHLSRLVKQQDFYDFDLIVGMDASNIDRLHCLCPTVEDESKIVMMTDYCMEKVADHVPDPYYGGASGFENVLDILEDACEGLMMKLKN